MDKEYWEVLHEMGHIMREQILDKQTLHKVFKIIDTFYNCNCEFNLDMLIDRLSGIEGPSEPVYHKDLIYCPEFDTSECYAFEVTIQHEHITQDPDGHKITLPKDYKDPKNQGNITFRDLVYFDRNTWEIRDTKRIQGMLPWENPEDFGITPEQFQCFFAHGKLSEIHQIKPEKWASASDLWEFCHKVYPEDIYPKTYIYGKPEENHSL